MTPSDAELFDVIRKAERDSLAWSLESLAPARDVRQIMFLNAHGVNWAARSAAFRHALMASDHLLRDGVGLALGLRILGLRATENLNGTDLIPRILERNKTAAIAVWGSSDEALEKLALRLRSEGCDNIVSLEHGFHDDVFYLDRYRAIRPGIVVLCMGMPRQELLAGQLAAEGTGGVIICGGGWANFYSGHIARAPLWVRRLRLEWLHRLGREPIRLGRRYTVDVVRYFGTIGRLARQRRKA